MNYGYKLIPIENKMTNYLTNSTVEDPAEADGSASRKFPSFIEFIARIIFQL
jgi:hypothetical protein